MKDTERLPSVHQGSPPTVHLRSGGGVRTPAQLALRLQRTVGNRAASRLLQRSEPAVPTVRFSVKVDRVMDAGELLVEFALQTRRAEKLTRQQVEAGIAAGEIYWVDADGNAIPTAQGPTATAEDVAKGYTLLTVFAHGVTLLSGEELEEKREEFYALDDADEAEVNAQTNEAFWRATEYKVGEKLDPQHEADDRLLAQDWLRLRAHVVERRAEYLAQPPDLRRQLWEMVSPEARELLFHEGGTAELHPRDFDTALRVAQRISWLTAAERAEYVARVQGTTTSWRDFELAIDLYMLEREARGSAAEEREDAKTALFGLEALYEAYTQWLEARARPQHGGGFELLRKHAELERVMREHGFASIGEVQAYFDPRVAAFEAAFEAEALFVADEMLDRYRHVIWVETQRLLAPGELERFFGAVTAAGSDLEPLAERYPLLLDEHLRDSLEGVRTASRALDIVFFHAGERREAISATERNLHDDPKLIYGFDVLFAHAMVAEGVQEGSIYHRIALDRAEEIADDELLKGIMWAVIAIGAGLLTGGGGAVAVLGAATAATISVYQTLEEFRRYELESQAHDAGLLSADPSIAWVIVSAIGAGIDLAAVAGVVRSLAPAMAAFDETGDVARLTTAYDAAIEGAEAQTKAALQTARARVLADAVAEAEYRNAWRQVLLPAHRVNDVLSAAGESFGRLVYAVYATLKFHGRNLGTFLKTREARQLLGDLAENPAAHPAQLMALRQGFLDALSAQETVVRHGLKLGLRADEIDWWFAMWARTPDRSVEDMIRVLDRYAEPLAARGGSKFRYGTDLVTDAESLKHLEDYDLRIAGRGGIEHLSALKTEAGERIVTIEGRVLEGFKDRAKDAPNFNKTSAKGGSLFTAEELGLKSSDWEWAHLWGPGFGDEAAAGLMLAPKSVNQVWQNQGVEDYIRELGKRARAAGGNVRVKATAKSWGDPTPSGWVPPKGVDFLQRAEYTITLDIPGKGQQTIKVTLHVDQPPFKGCQAGAEPADAFDLDSLF